MIRMKQKILSLLVAVIAATGAWADDGVEVNPIDGSDNLWTFSMPASDVEVAVDYFTDEEIYTDGVELTKTDKNTWQLASMPAFDVELEIEYKAELTALAVSIDDWTYGATASTPTVTGNESNGTVTYEYKVKDAADDTYTTEVPMQAGDYTVRATVAETDDYADATATKDFTIEKAAGTISYETTEVSKTVGDEAFTNDLTNAGDGTVTYASDNVNVATVDSETGLVTITGTGTATIKATVVDGTNYTYATKTAQYTLTVTATTGISTVNAGDEGSDAEGWYDLNGRRLAGKPATKGVFIQNGKKVVIK